MIKGVFNNEIVDLLMQIEQSRTQFSGIKLPLTLTDKLRKSSRKKSSYASNRIEGNPLSEEQASEAIESSRRHYLKPEQEIRNYFDALLFLEKEADAGRPLSVDLLLRVQALIVRGEGAEKRGLRGPMPPGILFAVYDDLTGAADYIPPEASELKSLLDELFTYMSESADHPLVKAAIFHYQLLTIHPFEDGNGRTARLLADYYLDISGYGFGRIGSLEEYFAYDVEAYYHALQMGLPALYYSGRMNPPHPEIWITYFLKMMALHARRAVELATAPEEQQSVASYSFLNVKERNFLQRLLLQKKKVFTPIEMATQCGVTNRTIINWCATLAKNGFLVPDGASARIRAYRLTALALSIDPNTIQ